MRISNGTAGKPGRGDLMELLKKLCNASGAPGDESEIRQVLTDFYSQMDIAPTTDHVGNIFFVKEGKPGKPIIMLDAHMDEVALQVIGHTSEGELKVAQLGGIDDRVLASKHVLVGKEKIRGVIGLKPIHNQKHEEWDVVTPTNALVVDVGCKDKAEAERTAPLGTTIVFDTEFEDWGEVVKAKSFDDRAGCWAVCKTMEMETECTLVGSFTFGEEIGMKGAVFAVRRFMPDLVVSLEGTSAGDMPEVPEHQNCARFRYGPVITFEDRSVIIPRNYRLLLEDTAQKNDIQYQYKGTVTGGTNAGRMQFENGGTPCVVIAAPCRYIHSPVSLAAKSDLEAMVKLSKTFIQRIDKEGLPQ